MAKPKQSEMKGMESLKIKPLDTAMGEYVEARDNRMDLTKIEVAARKKLENLMREHKVKIYKNSDGDLVANLETIEEKARVKQVDSENGE